MHYAGLNTCDTANGEGCRVSLFVSGCSLGCKGCFNKDAQDPHYGKLFTDETMDTLLDALKEPYIDGLSLLGGDPLEPYNVAWVSRIVALVKHYYPEKTIWLWTGRRYDKVKDLPMMKYIDVIIDGPFVQKLKVKEGEHTYYGSTNQRVIWLCKQA